MLLLLSKGQVQLRILPPSAFHLRGPTLPAPKFNPFDVVLHVLIDSVPPCPDASDIRPKPKPAVKSRSKPAVKPKPGCAAAAATATAPALEAALPNDESAVLDRLLPLEVQYLQDALDDWIEDNEGAVPEKNPDWEREKASILVEFDETVRKPALAQHRRNVTAHAETVGDVDSISSSPRAAAGADPPDTVDAVNIPLGSSTAPEEPAPCPEILSSEGGAVTEAEVAAAVVDEDVHEDEDDEVRTGPEASPTRDCPDARHETDGESPDVGAATASPDVLPTRGQPFTQQQWVESFDADGRFRGSEWAVKSAIFSGGIEPECRVDVWPFLFGVHSFQTTSR